MSHTKSVEAYAEELRARNRDGRFGWSLQLSSTNSAQENLSQLEATLRTLGEQRNVQQVMQELDPTGLSNLGSISLSERLDRLSKEFQRDIQDAHGESFPSLTESTKVIFSELCSSRTRIFAATANRSYPHKTGESIGHVG